MDAEEGAHPSPARCPSCALGGVPDGGALPASSPHHQDAQPAREAVDGLE